MFERLFAQSGLSLDRLRALVEVGAAGSIVAAAHNDPIRQSQLSRQIKELEDFFQIRLTERHGRHLRLTASGRELARISRFFLLGLSNFHRGRLQEEQSWRVGASPTILDCLLLPILAQQTRQPPHPRFATETAPAEILERRLHELTLDFALVTSTPLSRPLQTRPLGHATLVLWVPRALLGRRRPPLPSLLHTRLPLALAEAELPPTLLASWGAHPARLQCGSFLAARTALETGHLAALLPDYLPPQTPSAQPIPLHPADLTSFTLTYHLAWNPRLLRLSLHVARQRDALIQALIEAFRTLPRQPCEPKPTRPS